MPNPNIPDSPLTGFNFDDAPGGDIPFDELFGSPEDGLSNPQTTAPTGGTPQPQDPTPQAEPAQFEIKTATGTVYKTPEDAIKGIEQKDTLIETLRQQLIVRTGIDPVTQKPVLPTNPQGPETNYLQDPAQFTKDLRAAVEKGDDAAYAQAQLKLLFDALAPVAPLMTDYARRSAMETVSQEIKDFQTFRQSPEFQQVMEKNAALRQAIEASESNYQLHGQLPELYKLTYWAAQGLKAPDLIKAAQAAAQAAAAAQPPARTPMQGTTLAPPVHNGPRPTVSTHEGRTALIKQLEATGVLDVKF